MYIFAGIVNVLLCIIYRPKCS